MWFANSFLQVYVTTPSVSLYIFDLLFNLVCNGFNLISDIGNSMALKVLLVTTNYCSFLNCCLLVLF